MESERILHPVINQIGVDTQNEVVKEEKRLRVDNQPYGNLIAEVKKHVYKPSLSLGNYWFDGSFRCCNA
jgi:zinc protease